MVFLCCLMLRFHDATTLKLKEYVDNYENELPKSDG